MLEDLKEMEAEFQEEIVIFHVKNGVQLRVGSNYSYSYFFRKYVRQMVTFKLLDGLFNQRFQTVEEAMNALYISRTSVY